jgi:hypothetical protein
LNLESSWFSWHPHKFVFCAVARLFRGGGADSSNRNPASEEAGYSDCTAPDAEITVSCRILTEHAERQSPGRAASNPYVIVSFATRKFPIFNGQSCRLGGTRVFVRVQRDGID